MKQVVVVLRHTPLNHIKNLEAFRLSLGLTLSNNEVVIAMVDEGVLNAIPFEPPVVDRPDVSSFLELYEAVGIRSIADGAALQRYGLATVRDGVEVSDRKTIIKLICQAEVVIPF